MSLNTTTACWLRTCIQRQQSTPCLSGICERWLSLELRVGASCKATSNYRVLLTTVTVLVLADSTLVILARGCRAKNLGPFAPRKHWLRDSSRAPDTRAGMTYAAALQPNRCNDLSQDSIDGLAALSGRFITQSLARFIYIHISGLSKLTSCASSLNLDSSQHLRLHG
jgi:hypothetical protein